MGNGVKHTKVTAFVDDPTAEISSDEWNGYGAHEFDLDATDVGADPAGTATTAVAAHAAASDPHPTYSTAAETAAAVTTHEAAGDPHPTYTTAAELATALGAYQPLDSDLTAIAALTTTSYGRSLLAAANAAGLRTLAGTVIGTDVEAHDTDLTTFAGLTPTNDDVVQRKAGAWANRTIAQLLADLAAAGTTFQPLDSDLTAIAALTTTSYGRAFLELANAAALRTAGGLVIGTDVEAHDTDLTTFAGLTPTNDDVVQRKAGAWANRTIAQLLADLAAAGTTFQPLDSDLTAIAALTTTSYGRSLLAAADAAALRTLAGTVIGTNVQAWDADLDAVAALTSPATNIPTSGEKTWLTNSLAGQVAFPASQNASSGANVQDDYEEGTWTPGFTFGGAAVGMTFTSRGGNYRKVGQIVVAAFFTVMNAKGSSTGTAALSGLPFTAMADANPGGGPAVYYNSMTVASPPILAVNNGATTAGIYLQAANTVAGPVSESAFNAGQYLYGIITYIAAA